MAWKLAIKPTSAKSVSTFAVDPIPMLVSNPTALTVTFGVVAFIMSLNNSCACNANGFKYIGEFRNNTFVGQILSDGNPTFWGSYDGEWTYYDQDGTIKITNLDNNWLQ